MPFGYAELEKFYEGLVTRARAEGITCAITSGMACVSYGLTETTKDCDLLYAPDAAERLLNLLHGTTFYDQAPSYRGNLSPPLDARWLRGGWTSHFFWQATGDGVPRYFRRSTQKHGTLAARHSGLLRWAAHGGRNETNKSCKDWPFVTALGVKLLEARDPRGWLHVYDEEILLAFRSRAEIPPEYRQKRPVLALVEAGDRRLRGALQAEIHFWHELWLTVPA